MAKLEHNRPECIGCGACVAIHPDGWEMADDGISDIIDSKLRDDGWEEKELTDKEDIQLHKEAAECCPVNVIHLTVDGKKVV